ncbi:MAG: bifunctional DNA-formamidopyrimidine glycosylase/DNA-(apurinic or apyrimidinic site) lyase [Phycisphaerae bacterium]|nr:bifunctional DNA-formamidopyrimidine glycosylase/DNA-(apurinic or apyrimidinic site) lyase [Phycisphaerae bacterium]
MPELPEVESVRRSLLPHLLGRRVASARLLRADICDTHDGTPPTHAHLLRDASIAELRRHGKQLAILAADGRALVVHLGMSGRLFVSRDSTLPTHAHALWTLDSDTRLVFEDPRRFGGIWTLPHPDALARRWADLGPDALDINGPALERALAGSRRPVKAALLDQRTLAGVGNIYADEALFAARIAPKARAGSIRGMRADDLALAIRRVLLDAIYAGGSTLRDYRDGTGQPGSAQNRHQVYARAGLPCLACGTPLRQASIAQRTTVWCPRCQSTRLGQKPKAHRARQRTRVPAG